MESRELHNQLDPSGPPGPGGSQGVSSPAVDVSEREEVAASGTPLIDT